MAIKFSSTKIRNNIKLVDKYLNLIYELKENLDEVSIDDLEHMMEVIEQWRGCIDEIELSVKSTEKFNTIMEKNNNYEYNDSDKEFIIY
jgi:hypothetical protein